MSYPNYTSNYIYSSISIDINYNRSTDQTIKQTLPKQGLFSTASMAAAINDLKTAAESAAESFEGIDDAFTSLVESVQQRGIAFRTNLSNTLGNSLIKVTKQFTFLEERNKDLNNTLGLSTVQSAKLGQALDNASKKFTVGGDSARVLATSLNSIIDGFVTGETVASNFGEALMGAQSYMRNSLKLTEEASLGYELYASRMKTAQGETGDLAVNALTVQSKIAEKIEEATGLQGVQKDLTSTIGSLASDLQLQYSRIPGSLELAVLKSRALGMSMADLNKTGTQLLNMESSIGDELEYQLLTGRRLLDDQGNSLTNAYREATIRGDANKQAEIMNEIIAKEGDTLQNNLYARQQMAKLLGTDEATLAKAIQKQELLEKLGDKAQHLMSLDTADFEAEAMKIRGDLDDAGKEALDEILKGGLHDTRTTAERTADAVEKIATMLAGDNQVEQITKSAEGIRKDILTGPGGTVSGSLLETTMKDTLEQPVVKAVTDEFASLQTMLISVVGAFKDLKNTIMTGEAVKVDDTSFISNAKSVDDAVIQFNKNDEFKLLASTDPGQLNEAAATLAGEKTAVLDEASIKTFATVLANILPKTMQGITIKTETGLGGDGSFNSNPWST